MIVNDNKSSNQNLYIRKLNGLGEKISVRDSLRVTELKELVRSLRSLEAVGLAGRDFNLVYKGRNITEKGESTLRELNIPSDGIIHLVFANEDDKKPHVIALNHSNNTNSKSSLFSSLEHHKEPGPLSLRVIFNNQEHKFTDISQQCTVLDFKKIIAIKLNLIYESLVLSHLGTEMVNEKLLKDYKLENETLISLKFNLNNNKMEKKTLETRMVSSVTFSDENNEPNQQNKNLLSLNSQFNPLAKLTSSSNSIPSDKDESSDRIGSKLTSLIIPNNNKNSNMYKSEINTFGKSEGVSKAALMFKNALHQKIIETESVVSGEFSEEASMSESNNSDPNCVLVTVKNEEETKEFIFECSKTHQIVNIKEKLLEIEKGVSADKLEISLEEDLFQSIDLNKSGCVTLNEIVKKMGKERAVFIYRII